MNTQGKKIWKFWIDTGGTFTDCLALTPDGCMKRIKVLSSAALRGRITGIKEKGVLKISCNWPAEKNIFEGYYFKLLGVRHPETKVLHLDLKGGSLQTDFDLDEYITPGMDFEITSGEEAPVLAARIASGKKLKEQLPALEMRLGSTKGTNALLERKGAKTVLVVTKGFADLIEIGTQQRPEIFALEIDRTKPLYNRVLEIDERTDASGRVIKKPVGEIMDVLVNELKRSGPEAVAVALMNSYKNDHHENELKELLEEKGFRYISISSEMAKEIRFYPRAQTSLVNAYLSPVIDDYLRAVKDKITRGSLKVMTSWGGLIDARHFRPKDSLLSGPAGGVVGAAGIAGRIGEGKIIAFDMGGTSTDVSRYDGNYDYRFESEIDRIPVFSPSLSIETVAAGGGSVCGYDGYRLYVGPESAGASPGPASYGAGGPLCLTDVNLLLGRLDPENFGIPLSRDAAKSAFEKILKKLTIPQTEEELLGGFLQIANEKMVEAIRKISFNKGYDPAEYALLAFGGAGGQHACAVAALLGMKKIIIPYDAGLLSAYGMGMAEVERFASRQVLRPLDDVLGEVKKVFEELEKEAKDQLLSEGMDPGDIYVRTRQVYLRFHGQENTLKIEYQKADLLPGQFREAYEKLFNHWIENEKVEVESLRLVAAAKERAASVRKGNYRAYVPEPDKKIRCFTEYGWREVPAWNWERLRAGAGMMGPGLLMSNTSTVYVGAGWQLELDENKDARLIAKEDKRAAGPVWSVSTEQAELELFANRFKSVADDMGAVLQRTAFSVNVKERLDFSCAVLDAGGYLVANAPHIPVHLGSIGLCVREVKKKLELKAGDVVITNHPHYGGSHLPDVTLISPVFDDRNELVGYVANRAHHAELGGITPGSFPAHARNLEEEGVVIPPLYLVRGGIAQWEQVTEILTGGPWPTRALNENIADFNGALASVHTGVEGIKTLCRSYGTQKVKRFMEKLQEYSAACLEEAFEEREGELWHAEERLDDGHRIRVKIIREGRKIIFDFTGSSPVHPGNLNATFAILTSTVIYVLRLMIDQDIPLNEGIMRNVEITSPECFLNPYFPDDPGKCPAVVGGNTETSQRTVDTLIKALGLAACSQGTMNNLIFGNEKFGFYETIGGGTGAGPGFDGADAVHQHMTNTRITDPEVMEFRYPVRVQQMAVRKGSGGDGKWKGGNGIVREIIFDEPVTLNLLGQHRTVQPYGLEGGLPGKVAEQYIIRRSGKKELLSGSDEVKLEAGDRIMVKTPGGGGYGRA